LIDNPEKAIIGAYIGNCITLSKEFVAVQKYNAVDVTDQKDWQKIAKETGQRYYQNIAISPNHLILTDSGIEHFYPIVNLKFFYPNYVKNVWQMTKEEFTNMQRGSVELLPIPLGKGKRERAVIHPSPKKKGYMQWSLIELNPKTGVWEPGSDIQFPDKQALRRHLEVIHRQEVKQAIDEGKSVPQKVLRDYPDLTKKLTIYAQEHVS